MSAPLDPRETRSDAERAAELAERLPAQIARAQAATPHFAETLADVDSQRITTREALAGLPVLRKADLIQRQADAPPFGGLVAEDSGPFERVFQSPGPIYEPQGGGTDVWRFARALRAAGVERGGGIVHNTFSYHFMPAGFMFDSAGKALDCPVFPAGPGQSEQQVRAMAQLRPRYYTGTPSFLNILLEKADELGLAVDSLERGLVTAEPLPASLVDHFRTRGIEVFECYGTADLGLIAYQTEAREGLVVDEDVVVEIVHPGTGTPVADGEVGEVVVTTLNPDYPLIRFATGDLSAVMPGTCPTGRTKMRIRGWMGRADQTTKVRGVFVHPEQIQELVGRFDAVRRARLVVEQADHRDVATLYCETADSGDGLAERIAETFRAVCTVGAEVHLAAPDTLPNDGKVIADQR
ncbi:phenylacetate-CoA ligase [Limimonas halophila]|uniref:Phenylacetate-CoA ligase n=1 Tax=Limimonas halophila TaxID=1082479 RepID=A0A1G7QKI9_9PROT|nr:AMP-binding protein [Limimonas halophila]SDF98419.1 phenylacetate-CoA ligase [Limimonas halophila]